MPSQVAVVRCSAYDPQMVRGAVRRAFDLLGGLSAVVQAGHRVLIKPNLLAAREPQEAITTHPEVVAAVVDEVKQAGGQPLIGDSPGATRRTIEEIWRSTGMEEVCRRTGATLVNIEAGGSLRQSVDGRQYFIARAALEADVIINLPKLKTHSLVIFTGAVKNMFGAVPGFHKRETHLACPRAEPFSRALVDVYSFVVPHMTLMDAVEGMDGDGPAAGRRRVVGLLFAGRDGVAVDAVAGWSVGIAPEEISTCRLASQRGLGIGDVESIQLVGDDLTKLDIEHFARPRSDLTQLVPTPLVHLLRRFVYTRPRIIPERCTNCNTCVRSCPTGALQADQFHPRFQPRKCISCLCCHELCPESAVALKWSLLARLAS